MRGLKTQIELAIDLLELEQVDNPTTNKKLALSYLYEDLEIQNKRSRQ